MRESDTLKRLEELLKRMPNYHLYFTDHGEDHVDRILHILDELLLPEVSPQLSDFEKDILNFAVYLHDVGMANPKTANNSNPEVPSTPDEQRRIRDIHESLSEAFVREYWRELGIPDNPTANAIARLCKCHRKSNYVRKIFPHESEKIGGEGIRVQLLAALLKLADALDTDFRRAPEKTPRYFLNLPDEDKWHWEACQYIQGVSSGGSAIRLEALIKSEKDCDKAEKIVRQKAATIFDELFVILPFLIPARVPWVMVEVLFQYQYKSDQKVVPAWPEWWYFEIKAGETEYVDLTDIAKYLVTYVRPTMTDIDFFNALKAISKAGYPVPPPPIVPSEYDLPTKTYSPISTPACKASFLDTLRGATQRIELMASDGLTFPNEVSEILGKKLLAGIKVTLFLLEPDVLYQIEGGNENLTEDMARDKVEIAKQRWQKWWQGLLQEIKDDAKRKAELRGLFQVVFVGSFELGHLNGSALIDDKILRLNVRRLGESSSRGMLFHCAEPVNLLYIVRHYIHDMIRFGRRWFPEEKEGEVKGQ
jgi:hypothetical protein